MDRRETRQDTDRCESGRGATQAEKGGKGEIIQLDSAAHALAKLIKHTIGDMMTMHPTIISYSPY